MILPEVRNRRELPNILVEQGKYIVEHHFDTERIDLNFTEVRETPGMENHTVDSVVLCGAAPGRTEPDIPMVMAVNSYDVHEAGGSSMIVDGKYGTISFAYDIITSASGTEKCPRPSQNIWDDGDQVGLMYSIIHSKASTVLIYSDFMLPVIPTKGLFAKVTVVQANEIYPGMRHFLVETKDDTVTFYSAIDPTIAEVREAFLEFAKPQLESAVPAYPAVALWLEGRSGIEYGGLDDYGYILTGRSILEIENMPLRADRVWLGSDR
ncbi:hypothetical protein SEA_CAMERICO_76 [Gordonia phage Camerico]|nr:hypothetical protein SEA_CAMERICO_76 [Gordonia phage Camerico]